MDFLRGFLLAASTGLVIVVVKCVYNVYFHPLANIPGPALAKFSRLWLFSEEMKGDAHNTILQWHRSHGKLIRISPDEISVNDYDAFTEIYKQGTRFLKAPYWYKMFSPGVDNIFTMTERDQHQMNKRLMSHAFSRAAILDHEALIYAKTLPLMEQIEDLTRQAKPTPLFPAFRRLTLDIITAFCFGDTYRGDDDTDTFSSPLFEPFDASPRAVIVFQQFPFLRGVANVMGKIFSNSTLAGFSQINEQAATKLRGLHHAMRNGQAGFGLFQTMLEKAKSKDQALSDDSLVAESQVMLFAGTDTTASTIALGLYNLLQRPELYSRLQKEVLELIPDVEARPSLVQLEQLPILDACIKEGLRLTCPIRGRLPRVVPSEGWHLEGYSLPPGTIVGSAPFHQCYDDSVFPDPFTYLPERWLGNDTQDLERYLQPFSRGTRQCIGQNLSLVEQRIALSQFVRRFSPARSETFPVVETKEYSALAIMSDMNAKLELPQPT